MCGPVNRVRLGQPPVERAVLLVHFFGEHRVNLVFFAQARAHWSVPPAVCGLINVGKVCPVRAEERRHFRRPLLLVIHVRVVEVLPHLVLEKPGQFAVDQHVVRVVTQALVAQQFDAALAPSASGRENP